MPQEMAEILTHAAFYVGWPQAWAAFRMAKDVYANRRMQNPTTETMRALPGRARSRWALADILVPKPGPGQVLILIW